MKLKDLILKYVFIFFAIVFFSYIAICNVAMSFSLVMNAIFITATVLMLLNAYLVSKPIDEKVEEPSFFYIFIRTSTIMFFSAIIILIIFNVAYPKIYLNDREKYDYIIVFGAGVKDKKTEIINGRMDKAIEYSKKYDRCKFVLTGAKGYDEPIEEALYMRDYMVKRGMDDRRLLIDTFSVNTNQNIVNSLDLIIRDIHKRNGRDNMISRPFKNDNSIYDLDFLNIGFLSSEFHLTRISLMAKKFGIEKPYVIGCKTRILFLPYQYVREDLSLFKALILDELKF